MINGAVRSSGRLSLERNGTISRNLGIERPGKCFSADDTLVTLSIPAFFNKNV